MRLQTAVCHAFLTEPISLADFVAEDVGVRPERLAVWGVAAHVEHGRESEPTGTSRVLFVLVFSAESTKGIAASVPFAPGRDPHILPLQAEEFADAAPGRNPRDDEVAQVRTGTAVKQTFLFAGLSGVSGFDQSAVARRFLREPHDDLIAALERRRSI